MENPHTAIVHSFLPFAASFLIRHSYLSHCEAFIIMNVITDMQLYFTSGSSSLNSLKGVSVFNGILHVTDIRPWSKREHSEACNGVVIAMLCEHFSVV